MISATQHRGGTLLLLPAVLLLASSLGTTTRAAAAAGSCADDDKLPANRSYAHCAALAQLGATLHWTYDASKSSLSVAFVAAPAAPGGWVAWGLNPAGEGMAGAQALVALKGSGSAAPTVKTYNISGYALGAPSPLEFPATEIAADAGGSGGKIRVYGKLQLRKGMKAVNQVWQVGSSVTRGAPDMHAMDADNLAAKGKLVLSDGAAASAPAPAGGPSSSGGRNDDGSPLSRPISGAAHTAGVSAPEVVVLAVLGFLTMPW